MMSKNYIYGQDQEQKTANFNLKSIVLQLNAHCMTHQESTKRRQRVVKGQQ